MALTLAVSPVEIIDRVLAVVNGVILTQTDVFGATAFGLVDPQPSGSAGRSDPGRAGSTHRSRARARRGEPLRAARAPEEAIAARADAIRARFPSPEAYQRAMASTGYTNERIHAAARDALRIETYFDQRFGAAVQPADRQILIADWKAGLRRRADVTIQYQPRTRM